MVFSCPLIGNTTPKTSSMGDAAVPLVKTQSDIVLGVGIGLLFLGLIGLAVAVTMYGTSCGGCVQQPGIVIVPLPDLGPGGQQQQHRCPNGSLPVCPVGAKLVQENGKRAKCVTPSRGGGAARAPTITDPVCPQCANGTKPMCPTGYELKSDGAEVGSGAVGPQFKCVNKTVPSLTTTPACGPVGSTAS